MGAQDSPDDGGLSANVQAVLDGEASYDDLSGAEQAVVRAEWERRITERRENLTLADILGESDGTALTPAPGGGRWSLEARIGRYPLDRGRVEQYKSELFVEIQMYDDWLDGTGLSPGYVAALIAPDDIDWAEARRRLDALINSGDLLAIDGTEGPWIPSWQLDWNGQVLPRIRELAAARPGSVEDLTGWVLAPHPDLDGRTPFQALLDGDTDRVLHAAEGDEPSGPGVSDAG